MAEKFRVQIPKSVLQALPETTTDSIDAGIEQFLKLTERLKSLGAPGIHLFVIADTIAATVALQRLAGTEKQVK
jgi:hypothetical protein